MPRKCSACLHPRRDEIDKALVAGTSYRDIAGQFNLSKSAVERHAKGHIPATLVKAKEAEEAADADDLLADIRHFKDKAVSILETAEDAGDLRTALAGIKEARGCLELQTRMLCEMDRRERERPGSGMPSTKPPAHKMLIVDRTPEEQREFERVIARIRAGAKKVGVKLPEGDGDPAVALREAGLPSVEWSFEERMKLQRAFEEIMEEREKRGKSGPARL